MSTSTTTSTSAVQLPAQRRPALQDLAAALRGELALPGSDSYQQLTAGFNAAVQPHPLAVAAVADAYDVARTVEIAGRYGLRVAVQCTGHGAGAEMDDAVLVHTGALDECVVHPEGWARIGAGVRWRTVIDAAAPLGWTPLAGSSSGVGVVGYTTGGGLGPLARTYGWASDCVRALDVVTGDGRLVRATPTEHADLFWGLRGGKGSLGVVTAVELDLVPLRSVYGGAVYFAGEDLSAVLHAWRRWAHDLPETATTSLAVLQLPPLPHVPPPLAGRMTVAVRLAFVGPADEGADLLVPLRAVAAPLLDTMGVLPVTGLDAIHSDPTEPVPAYERSGLLADLTPDGVDELVRVVGPGSGSPLAVVELRRLGGAVARPGAHPSALCGRDAGFSLVAIGMRVPGLAEPVAERCELLLSALQTWLTGATLPNFAGGAHSYDTDTLTRLRAVARQHDPGRVLLAADPIFDTPPA